MVCAACSASHAQDGTAGPQDAHTLQMSHKLHLKQLAVRVCVYSGGPTENCRLYVYNLPFTVDWAELKRIFKAAGSGG